MVHQQVSLCPQWQEIDRWGPDCYLIATGPHTQIFTDLNSHKPTHVCTHLCIHTQKQRNFLHLSPTMHTHTTKYSCITAAHTWMRTQTRTRAHTHHRQRTGCQIGHSLCLPLCVSQSAFQHGAVRWLFISNCPSVPCQASPHAHHDSTVYTHTHTHTHTVVATHHCATVVLCTNWVLRLYIFFGTHTHTHLCLYT